MFYSQFILAKKGPLGTIWIAAHLERKLRKNQVADTDIGVSVDSILSPDVPIALRLSSHLLLGVVRIYSRKVNYLFDDCSEALLKIKQAFRSAAVDLPPEESTAPYHSITLPETFDLDDFELPDNDIFLNNFVDHHISSREQITLQDTMEGVSYSTSKFGLDERFGDGDASGLDLDEELFLNKIDTASHVNESVDPQPSAVSLTPLKQDGEPETGTVNSETMVDLDDDNNLMDYAQAPCTPGLLDEPNLSNVQEVSACDEHLEFESHLAESAMTEKAKNTDEDKQEVDWCSGNNKSTDATPMVQTEENGAQSVDADLSLSQQQGEVPIESGMGHVLVDVRSPRSDATFNLFDKKRNPTSEFFEKMMDASDATSSKGLQNGSVNKGIHSSPPVDNPCDDHQGPYYVGLENSACEISGQTSMCKQPSEGLSPMDHGSLQFEAPGSVETGNDQEKLSQIEPSIDFANLDESASQNPDTQTPRLSPSSIYVNENVPCAGVELPLPCKSNLQQPDSGCAMSTAAEIQADDAVFATSEGEERQGKARHATDNMEENLMGNNIQGDLHPAFREPEGEVHNEGYQDKPTETELLAPEKLLSVHVFVDHHKNMLEGSPGEFVGLYESHAGNKNVSGKKRSFTESTLTEQSLNSVESSRLIHFKRTVESIPDDDDLLSSILVGRSSVLKVKPTPRLSEATSVKRTRLASRTATPKRKVLMDDAMVLHGDTIRQQLTFTEDIRRVRKKAPCTLPEISVIQKQCLEDEIFLKPTVTGTSSQLSSLHSRIWDFSRIKVCKNDLNGVSGQNVVEAVLPSRNDEKISSHETIPEPSPTFLDPKNDDSLSAAAEPYITSQSAENGQSVDTKVENGPGEINVTEQSNMRITEGVLLDGDKDEAEQSVNPHLSDRRMTECDDINIINEQIETTGHVDVDFSFHGLLSNETGVEQNQKDDDTVNSSVSSGVKLAETTGDASDDILETPVGLLQEAAINETNGTNTTAEVDTPAVLPDQKMDLPSLGFNSTGMDIGNEQTISAHFMEKDGCINPAVESVPVTRDDFLSGVVNDSGNTELFSNAEHERIVASIYQADINMGDDNFVNNGDNPEQLESYPSYMMNTHPGFDLHDQEELNYYAAGNDTDFLNVDDDELNDMADDEIPDDEEARFAENTGWSSRTRAVSKYLQTLFIKEAEHGRKSLSMDNLLTGKSRKEASRMFFEALVLKTRDYIHVEQQNTFDDITIKPRARLLKSDF